MKNRYLIALDIDGTVLREDGSLGDSTVAEIGRLRDAGHEIMLATGRSVAMTLPVLDRLGITPQYVVCSNGAITLRRDSSQPLGYAREYVETFDPSEVLQTIKGSLDDAHYAVEDENGLYRFTGYFPDGALGANSIKVDFDELLARPATRVVVISPEHAIEDFLSIVEKMGLHRVSYNVGWTAWLDSDPADGRNDIDMLEWAAAGGVGVAMGQAPDEVVAAANARTDSDLNDGVATYLSTL